MSPPPSSAPSGSYQDLRRTMTNLAPELPRRLAQAARFAMDNPDEVALGTAASVAAHAGVQPSTLVRLAQALGYSGFSQMQAVFRERLRGPSAAQAERLEQLRAHGVTGANAHLILEQFAQTTAHSLERLRAQIDPETLEDAVTTLAGARTIHLIGLRRAYPVAAYLAYALGSLGVRAALIDAVAGLAPEQAGLIGPDDAALAISFSPYAPQTIELAGRAKAQGAPLIAITDSVFSPLAALADAWFEIAEADYEGFRSLGASMTLAMTLAIAVAERRKA